MTTLKPLLTQDLKLVGTQCFKNKKGGIDLRSVPPRCNNYLLRVSTTDVESTKAESATTKVLSVADATDSVVEVELHAVIANTSNATIAKIDFFMFILFIIVYLSLLYSRFFVCFKNSAEDVGFEPTGPLRTTSFQD